MFTRKQYLDHECSHREYYGQFVTPYIRNIVAQVIGVDALISSKDEHLNDIPLFKWDQLSEGMKNSLAIPEYGDGKRYYSLGSGVCILKEAARQIVEQSKSGGDL